MHLEDGLNVKFRTFFVAGNSYYALPFEHHIPIKSLLPTRLPIPLRLISSL